MILAHWWELPIVAGGQEFPGPDDPDVQLLVGGRDPIARALKAAQDRLSRILTQTDMTLSQEQRNDVRQRVASQFRGIAPQEAENVLSRLTDQVLQNMVSVSIRAVAARQQVEQGRLFGSTFQTTILQPIINAQQSARTSGDLSAAAGHAMLLADLQTELPRLQESYFQYWLSNRPEAAPEMFDQNAPMHFLLSWWPRWSQRAVQDVAHLGLASSYEHISGAVQGLIDGGVRLGQAAKQNMDKLETDLNRLRVSLTARPEITRLIKERPELKGLIGGISESMDTIVRNYAQVAGRINPRDYLNQNLPGELQVTLAGYPEASSVVMGDGMASVQGLIDSLMASSQTLLEKKQAQSQMRIGSVIQQLSTAYPNIAKKAQQVLGDIPGLQEEADKLGIPLEALVKQKEAQLQDAGELDRKLEAEGEDAAFRQKITAMRGQQGDIKTDVDVLLSQLEREHGASIRQAEFESGFARTAAINESTLLERDLSNKTRESLRNLDTEKGNVMLALQQEEEDAVKQAVAGTPPTRIRDERERAVRQQFRKRGQVLAQEFDKRQKEIEANLDVRLKESETGFRGKLAEIEKAGFQRSEQLKAKFGERATLLQKELINRVRQLRQEENIAVQQRDTQKVQQIQVQTQALIAAITAQEKRVNLPEIMPPTTQTPTTAQPVTATPTIQTPATAQPLTGTPTTQTPATAQPLTGTPTTQTPTTAQPVTATPTTQTPATAQPTPPSPPGPLLPIGAYDPSIQAGFGIMTPIPAPEPPSSPNGNQPTPMPSPLVESVPKPPLPTIAHDPSIQAALLGAGVSMERVNELLS